MVSNHSGGAIPARRQSPQYTACTNAKITNAKWCEPEQLVLSEGQSPGLVPAITTEDPLNGYGGDYRPPECLHPGFLIQKTLPAETPWFHPNTPVPRSTSHNRINTSTAINQISSDFIVISPSEFMNNILSLAPGSWAPGTVCLLHPGGSGYLLDYNVGFRFSPPDLVIGNGGHLRLEAQGPHHYDAQNPPGYLPGPCRWKAEKGRPHVAYHG